MEIARDQAEKLGKFFINADPFMWGVLQGKNKKARLRELKELGFLAAYSEGGNPIYSKINKDLLIELGIAGILGKIVVPRIQISFGQEILRHFRDCWDHGQTPELKYLNKNKLYHSRNFVTLANQEVYDDWTSNPPVVGYKDRAFVFVQIDTQHNFVERWTVFAGLWFEEIEPLLQ
jgi:hypothetical protein